MIHNKLIYYDTRKNQHQRKSGFNTQKIVEELTFNHKDS